jgi:hypothetical protein
MAATVIGGIVPDAAPRRGWFAPVMLAVRTEASIVIRKATSSGVVKRPVAMPATAA